MRRKIEPPQQYPDDQLTIESLDMEAQGIAHRDDGKVVFVEGALPFERVVVHVNRSKPSYDKASVVRIQSESSQRVVPGCPHFGLHQGACGGCKMQHMHVDAQVAVKQRVLEDNLWHLGKVRPDNLLRPIQGPSWGYRYRARLSVRYVRKKQSVLVGFHERKSGFVADMQQCLVLPDFVSALLMPLRALIAGLQAREACPQIELAVGDDGAHHVVALVLRHMLPLSSGDLASLRAFAARHSRAVLGRQYSIQWWLQPQGPESISLLDDGGPQLAYNLPDFAVHMPFRPTDFTQVNPQINRVLVQRALRLLDTTRQERVIDWFCGLGNFTLPLATLAAQVLGVEGSRVLVERAQANLQANRTSARVGAELAQTQFVVRNLFEMTPRMLLADGSAHKWLLDPPREGAASLVKALADLRQIGTDERPQSSPGTGQGPTMPAAEVLDRQDWVAPMRIVYVSCNPATLARDASILVHQAGYRCSYAGVVNMFPHTAHVESMAVFDRVNRP